VSFETSRVIAADHPSLPGHFPGNPIVPGVVILDEVAAAVAQWRPGFRLRDAPVVKFLRPLLPDQMFVIHLRASGDDKKQVEFRCAVDNHIIVEGRLRGI
jgi:3-hydroxymyristoyl/3-hydroxydecanoyl-(acyl carrier protein) dehydratase